MLRMLMRQDVAETIGRAYRTGISATAKQLEEFRAARTARPNLAARTKGARAAAANEPGNFAVVGNVAIIEVAGILSEQPDFLAWLFGLDQTTYRDIRDSLAMAGADSSVQSVKLRVSSPGGYVDGLFETLGTIQGFSKPIAVTASMACSAAYAIAAVAGPIRAKSPASEFGSVGVAAAFYVDPQVVDIASTEAPNKRPDVTTDEGQEVVRSELDAMHELFADAIATGRHTSVAIVNAEYGRGGVLLAGEALSRGMIDSMPSSLAEAASTSANATALGGESEVTNMTTKQQLKRTNPDLYEEILEEGRGEERSRVKGHMTLARASGDWKSAHVDIEKGVALTPEVSANHMAASMNRKAIRDRQEESDEVGDILGGMSRTPGDGQKDLGDLVCDAMGLPPAGYSPGSSHRV